MIGVFMRLHFTNSAGRTPQELRFIARFLSVYIRCSHALPRLGSRFQELGNRNQPKTTALKIRDYSRQRVRRALDADVHQDDGAIEFRICPARDAVNQELLCFSRFHRIKAIERPVDRAVSETRCDAKDPLIACPKGCSPSGSWILSGNLRQQIFGAGDLFANDCIRMLG